jgi:hypothetical protein
MSGVQAREPKFPICQAAIVSLMDVVRQGAEGAAAAAEQQLRRRSALDLALRRPNPFQSRQITKQR